MRSSAYVRVLLVCAILIVGSSLPRVEPLGRLVDEPSDEESLSYSYQNLPPENPIRPLAKFETDYAYFLPLLAEIWRLNIEIEFERPREFISFEEFTFTEYLTTKPSALESALRSRSYDVVQAALQVIDKHNINLQDDQRTPNEIMTTLRTVDLATQSNMDEAINTAIWYLSPTEAGLYYGINGPIRHLTIAEKNHLRSKAD